ncbi:TPA: transposase, partial [Vibrio parahaemolyticus]|nr:transposase [Vibrio parahaemolyticus]
MCKVFGIHPSGYYSWLKNPDSRQEKRRKYLLGLIKQFCLESGCVYGYRKIYSDLRDEGEICGINQVHSLMKREGIQSQRGYRKPRPKGG